MDKKFEATQYKLVCVATGREFEDEGWVLDDRQSKSPSLVRAQYEKKQLTVGEDDMGLYKFADWLPVNHTLKGSAAPVTYKSEGLAKELGLENLYITFNGYWPEKGAAMKTCSFKETEAYSVCARMDADEERVLVVASAGNTARAFARVCSDCELRQHNRNTKNQHTNEIEQHKRSTTIFACKQNLCTGCSLRIWECAVLFYDKRIS